MKKDEVAMLADEKINNALLSHHINFLYGDIEEDNIAESIKWIIYENLTPSDKPLTLYINSNGGNLQDAFALIEVMKKSKKPIITIAIGSVCSSAFLIFASGTKGYRYVSKTASAMCHQFSDEFNGKYHDIKAAARENELANERMLNVLKESTKLETRTIRAKLLPPTDAWFTAEELVSLGVADHIF